MREVVSDAELLLTPTGAIQIFYASVLREEQIIYAFANAKVSYKAPLVR